MSEASADIVYLVFNVRGGLASRGNGAPPGRTDPEAIIDDIVSGRYDDPSRVVAFNLAEGWARDVSLYVRVASSHRARSGDWDDPGSGAPHRHRTRYDLN